MVFSFTNSNDNDNDNENDIVDLSFNIDTKFKLPIQYLDDSNQHILDENLLYDLELKTPSNYNIDKTMYHYLFKPTNEFANYTMNMWEKQFTNDIHYLNDTKSVISNMDKYDNTQCEYSLDCNKFKSVWNDIKLDTHFLEKYNYMDWEMLKSFNESSSFLQILSFIHVISPIISFVLPVLFIIFPFIILKIQGIPIDINTYVITLKSIAQNHFIGKAISSFQSISWDKLVYIMFLLGMYVFQIYQNIILCKRFYSNSISMNNNMYELKQYVNYTIHSFESFQNISQSCKSYTMFNHINNEHLQTLYEIKHELCDIYQFEPNLQKFNTMGYMLRCYYQLHSNSKYENCLRYTVGFHGYIDNLQGICSNIQNGVLSYANFDNKNSCSLEKQYYPGLTNEKHVKNNCDFKKNMIISSPNKSGKTTILKSTALNIIFSQQVGCGFYKSATITPFTHIHSYINIPDTSGRDSLFQAESRRCKDIIDIIQENVNTECRHFCMFDELYSGTNPTEASKAGYAFLEYLQQFNNVNFILTTHYLSICKKFKNSKTIQNYKMIVDINTDGTFNYTYKIKKGISNIKGGIRVLKDMNYPDHIIKTFQDIH